MRDKYLNFARRLLGEECNNALQFHVAIARDAVEVDVHGERILSNRPMNDLGSESFIKFPIDSCPIDAKGLVKVPLEGRGFPVRLSNDSDNRRP